MKLTRLIPALALLVLLPACDSGPGQGSGTMFLVRYEAEGTCTTISAVGYTIPGGGTGGTSVNLPWSFEATFDTAGATSPVAVALALNCLGAPNVTHTITARVYVDGTLRDEQTASGSSTLGRQRRDAALNLKPCAEENSSSERDSVQPRPFHCRRLLVAERAAQTPTVPTLPHALRSGLNGAGPGCS